VDFELTDEQRLFQRTLRDFADKEIVPVAQELAIGEGTNDIQRLVIARALVSGASQIP
jgi:alkylation response protein AidB-like acyl-CoA dehydrogenase